MAEGQKLSTTRPSTLSFSEDFRGFLPSDIISSRSPFLFNRQRILRNSGKKKKRKRFDRRTGGSSETMRGWQQLRTSARLEKREAARGSVKRGAETGKRGEAQERGETA